MVLIRPCRTTAGLEAIPDLDWDLDIASLEPRLKEEGWALRVNAGIMLIVRKRYEATIFRNGRVLIKTQDEQAARQVWDALEGPMREASRRGR